jgi:cell division septal protein FtsQ
VRAWSAGDAPSKAAIRVAAANYATSAPPSIITNLLRALQLGTKYIYQALPRIITLWAELGEDAQVMAFQEATQKCEALTAPCFASLAHQV